MSAGRWEARRFDPVLVRTMKLNGKKLLLCNCEISMALDGGGAAAAL
ncbi:MAG: hypothetical protein ACR2QF_17830 [Geminicoccaceae bacterium]